MRPAKFFFALIFAGVFLITLMKVLFFGLIAAAVFGSVFFMGRAFRRFGGRGHYGHPGYYPQENARWQPPFVGQGQSTYIQPLDPSWQPRQRNAPVGRRIEVL